MSQFDISMQSRISEQVSMKRDMERLKDKMTANAAVMEDLMRKENQWTYQMLMDEDILIVVQIDETQQRKLNKEEMANDLGVVKSALKTSYLLGEVENGRLSREKYEKYHYYEPTVKFKMKKKKPKKGRKGKKA